jgi:hypothetical protein
VIERKADVFQRFGGAPVIIQNNDGRPIRRSRI